MKIIGVRRRIEYTNDGGANVNVIHTAELLSTERTVAIVFTDGMSPSATVEMPKGIFRLLLGEGNENIQGNPQTS